MHTHACTNSNHISVITYVHVQRKTLYLFHMSWSTHTHILYINQTKSFSTTGWCHCTAIIHPSGSSGQHRSVSHSRPNMASPPISEDSWANQGWWAFMNNAHIDSSAHMKMDSWPILTRLLIKKNKLAALNPAEVSPHWGVLGNHTMLLKWEGGRSAVIIQSDTAGSQSTKRVYMHS